MIVVCAPGSRSRRCSSSSSPPAAARGRRTTRSRRPRRCPGPRSSRPSSPSGLPSARRCSASDLTLQGDVEFVPGGPGGRGGIAVIALRTRASRRAGSRGARSVKLVKNGGPKQVNEPSRAAADLPGHGVSALEPARPKPGEVAGLTVTWENWCDPQIPGKKRVPPSAVRITLPNGGGDLDADYNAVPPCSDPKSPSTIGVSPFETAKVRRRSRGRQRVVHATVPASRSTPSAARCSASSSCSRTRRARRSVRPVPGVRPAARARGPGRGARAQLRRARSRSAPERARRSPCRSACRRTRRSAATASSGPSTRSARTSRRSTLARRSTADAEP